MVYLAKLSDMYVAVKVRSARSARPQPFWHLDSERPVCTHCWTCRCFPACWMCPAPPHSPRTAAQVFAVQPGMDSQGFWREISLLARCEHPRIVPVYGVAVHVRACCAWLLLL